MRCGIEFEYLLVDRAGPTAGRIRDFSNLSFDWIAQLLEAKPGLEDGLLARGDQGIRSGYWYLEGDERFHPDGRFRTLEVKGVEIRTPPLPEIAAAIDRLLQIERQLSERLASQGLGLGIAAYHPLFDTYVFDPPLNAWERQLRDDCQAYDGAEVFTLSYGPDINLSFAGWDIEKNLDVARKLNHYAPLLVAFSCNSPFAVGQRWEGPSRRTFLRCTRRPAVKLYLSQDALARQPASSLLDEARIPSEQGRIEFKAFDALPSPELLAACCHLLLGLCLDTRLPGRSETADVALYQQVARSGLADERIHAAASDLLQHARQALLQQRGAQAAAALEPLQALLQARQVPAMSLLAGWQRHGLMYQPGGLATGL